MKRIDFIKCITYILKDQKYKTPSPVIFLNHADRFLPAITGKKSRLLFLNKEIPADVSYNGYRPGLISVRRPAAPGRGDHFA